MRNALSRDLRAKKTISEAILRLHNGHVTRASGRQICWRPNRKFAKNCFTKQAKKHLIELEPFTISTWAQTLPTLTRWMQPPPLSNGRSSAVDSSFLNTVPNSGSSLWKSLTLRFGSGWLFPSRAAKQQAFRFKTNRRMILTRTTAIPRLVTLSSGFRFSCHPRNELTLGMLLLLIFYVYVCYRWTKRIARRTEVRSSKLSFVAAVCLKMSLRIVVLSFALVLLVAAVMALQALPSEVETASRRGTEMGIVFVIVGIPVSLLVAVFVALSAFRRSEEQHASKVSPPQPPASMAVTSESSSRIRKQMNRLNGWQRAWVVLAIIWALPNITDIRRTRCPNVQKRNEMPILRKALWQDNLACCMKSQMTTQPCLGNG